MSQLRHVELASKCESIKTNTYYVLAGLMTGHRAGSRACSWLIFFNFFFLFFFFVEKIEPATRRWGSYEALSQLRGAEPATKHWASYVSLSQQGSFELARRQWASKVALSFIIYIYIYTYAIPNFRIRYNILNLGQNIFFEGDTYLWAGAGMWKVTFDFSYLHFGVRHVLCDELGRYS